MNVAIVTNKLTVNMPETLRRRVKAVAALRGESVSDIVRAALESYVADALEEQEDIRVIQTIEERLASGKSRRYTHEEVWAEIEQSR